jgi:catechol 2,3-dioxygenase-like lactoylglutathione lyase family enzyme
VPEADFDRRVAALRAHGHEVPVHEFGPLADGAPNSRSAYVHDPDGHLVEFWTAEMRGYGAKD